MLFLCCLVIMCSGFNDLYLLIFFCDLLRYFFVVYFLHIKKKGFYRLIILADEIPFFVILSYFTIPSMNAISLIHLVGSFSNL